MGKYREIKWMGRAGQGVTTASAILAEIMAEEGKYVQAFPEFIALKRWSTVTNYTRIADSPIKTHSGIAAADMVVVMDARLLLNSRVKEQCNEYTGFIVNTSDNPDFIREKLNLQNGNHVYTIDADAVVRSKPGPVKNMPNIAMLSVLVKVMNWLTVETFKQRVHADLSRRIGSESATDACRVIDRALLEIKQYEP